MAEKFNENKEEIKLILNGKCLEVDEEKIDELGIRDQSEIYMKVEFPALSSSSTTTTTTTRNQLPVITLYINGSH